MSLAPGTRIGHYHIDSPLGVGGMGEVYRATDTSLGRAVAIKVLPETFAADAERVARFEREARTLASLNHPNIAQVFGLERQVGIGADDSGGPQLALAMELVEGPTLAEKIATGDVGRTLAAGTTGGANSTGAAGASRGADTTGSATGLPIDEAIAIARQIAEALEAAHDQGIVHRDLKPANVKVRDDGAVKVLDFGLAKAVAGGSGGTSVGRQVSGTAPDTPTITTPAMTQAGLIMGTAAYMSPEQARGRSVDRRADIWAFGCVLYEMLTGTRAFPGDDISDVLVAVLRDEPNLAALPPATPPHITTLLRRCLQKDPRKRLPHIGAARLELSEPATLAPGIASAPTAPVQKSRALERAAWAAMGAAVAGALAFVLIPRSPESARPQQVVLEIAPPAGTRFPGANGAPRFAVSPDGSAVAYQVQVGAETALFVRRLDSTTGQEVVRFSDPVGNASQGMFWSPDSRSLAFFDEPGHQLKRMDLQGRAVTKVCDVPGNQLSGTWSAEGIILLSSVMTGGIWKVPAAGGATAPVTTLDTARGDQAHLFPSFLPDGNHFLYLATGAAPAVYVGSLDGGTSKKLIDTASATSFAAPDSVLYLLGDSLVARRIDLDTFEFVGEPTPIASAVLKTTAGRVAASASRSGVVAYASAQGEAGLGEVVWLNRAGRRIDAAPVLQGATSLRLSPDGKLLGLIRSAASSNEAWIYDIEREVPTRLSGQTGPGNILISPDGSRVVYRRDAGGAPVLVQQPVSGATQAEVIMTSTGEAFAVHDWTPDGRHILVGLAREGNRSLYRLPLAGDRTPIPYLVDGLRYHASISPDGRWVAYTSLEGGQPQVFLQSFPDPSGVRLTVSKPGAQFARWRRDGRELYFIEYGGRLMAAPVSGAPRPEIGEPVQLFEFPVNVGRYPGYPYDAAPDGQSFVVLRPDTENPPTLTVVVNWRR